MIKTQVQLEDWQYREAKRLGASLSRSLSDLVREGLTVVLKQSSQRPVRPLSEIAGSYSSRPAEDLKTHDRDWAASIR